MSNWQLDMTFAQKERLVQAKARACGISELEAYKLCVLEYETGKQLDKVTVQTENAYNQYKLEGNRPNTRADVEHKIKVYNELMLKRADALRNKRRLEKAANKSVEERIDVKHGLGTYAAITTSKEDSWFKIPEWLKVPKLPKVSLPGASKFMSTKVKLAITLLGAFVLLMILLVAIGYSGMGSSVGRVAESEHKRKRG